MTEEKNSLLTTPAPHIKAGVVSFMTDTMIALTPAALFGIYLFGAKAIVPMAISIATAALAECGMLMSRKKSIRTIDITSGALTGLLLALTLPPGIAWYAVVVGAAVSIIVAKHLFGGLGFNIFNPALVGRAFLMASWPAMMTTWLAPLSNVDAVTTATPLAIAKYHLGPDIELIKMLFGLHAGSIGETCAIALILGGIFLLARKVIEWRIPLSYIATVAVLSLLFKQGPAFQVLAGGLLLGAFFMAADPVTTPVTKPGRWIFGIGCGIITMVIRFLGGYPEGVCYAILIMNSLVPLLDRYARGKAYGT